MSDPTEVVSHGKLVKADSIWLVRVYVPAKPAYATRTSTWPARPAYIEWEIAQAKIGEFPDDETDEYVVGVGWMMFGTEIPILNSYIGDGKYVQPVKLLTDLNPERLGKLFEHVPLPEGWVL